MGFVSRWSVSTAWAATALLVLCHSAAACDERTPCETPTGRYHVRPPEGWNGSSPLPVVVFFHGYQSSARDVMDDADLAREISGAGALLVAPDGMNKAWSIPGTLFHGRDDIAFVRSVMKDVERRYPVDRSRLLASGFSAGGFIVWAVACNAGELFAGYAPVAGAFLDPIPRDCPSGPVSVRHIHGMHDDMVPMQGRWIAGGTVKQSDVETSIGRLRALDRCPDAPTSQSKQGDLSCRTWSANACASGKEIVLCLHDDGHKVEAGWVGNSLQWLSGLSATARRPGSAANKR